jgi:hypothetical protein
MSEIPLYMAAVLVAMKAFLSLCACQPPHRVPSKGPMWGYPRLVVGALGSLLEPFCGHVLPKVDKLCSKLTFEYPHEEPCVDTPVQDTPCADRV